MLFRRNTKGFWARRGITSHASTWGKSRDMVLGDGAVHGARADQLPPVTIAFTAGDHTFRVKHLTPEEISTRLDQILDDKKRG